jgi:hypothetical protein
MESTQFSETIREVLINNKLVCGRNVLSRILLIGHIINTLFQIFRCRYLYAITYLNYLSNVVSILQNFYIILNTIYFISIKVFTCIQPCAMVFIYLNSIE